MEVHTRHILFILRIAQPAFSCTQLDGWFTETMQRASSPTDKALLMSGMRLTESW